jgi:hypothetical protein
MNHKATLTELSRNTKNFGKSVVGISSTILIRMLLAFSNLCSGGARKGISVSVKFSLLSSDLN